MNPQPSGSKPDMSDLNNRARLDVMLCEYNAAQDSALHYNSLLWQVISIFTAANAVLVGIGLSIAPQACTTLSGFLLILGAAFLGMLMNGFAWACSEVFRTFQANKYDRSKAIEQQISTPTGQTMELHTKHKSPCISQKWFYRFVLFVSILYWIGFATVILFRNLRFVGC